MIVSDLSTSFHPVPKIKTEKNTKKSKLKKRSNKLAKIERKRDKEINKEGQCECCHNFFKHLDPHEIYGGCNRKRSIENKFVKTLCRSCHSNEDILLGLKIDTQKEYEKTHTRQEFINLIGKSFVKEEF